VDITSTGGSVVDIGGHIATDGSGAGSVSIDGGSIAIRGTNWDGFSVYAKGFYSAAGGDVTLTAVRTGRARIDLAAELFGTVLFVGAGEQIEAEVVKRAGEPVTVALVPGSYDVRWRAPDKLWTARVRLRHGDQLTLGQSDFTEQPLVAVTDKGARPPAQSAAPEPPVGSSQPTPLTDVPIGGGSGWTNGNGKPVPPPAAAPTPAPDPEGPPESEDDPLASENGDPYEREFDDGKSFGKHPDAFLWPPVMMAIGFVGPGVPQILDKRYAQGAAILGVTVMSLAGAGLLGWSAHTSPGDTDEVTGVKLVGATAFGFAAFYTYSYGIIDAFYSSTRGGPGKPDLDQLDLDLALAVAPSLVRTTEEVKMTVGGGLGAGLAVHRNVVIGLRNVSGTYGHGVGSFQLGPELRLRGMILQRLGWSVSVGAVVQVHREIDIELEDGTTADESAGRWDWAMYPYLVGMLHYFPARSWSLDFGVRAGVAVGTRRMHNEVAQPQTAASIEYIGGLTWYY